MRPSSAIASASVNSSGEATRKPRIRRPWRNSSMMSSGTTSPACAPHVTRRPSLASDGRLVTCGAHAGEVVPLDIIELFRHGRRILGFRVASPDEFTDALAMALDGRITVPVDRAFPLSAAGDAHAYMDERRHV